MTYKTPKIKFPCACKKCRKLYVIYTQTTNKFSCPYLLKSDGIWWVPLMCTAI